MIGRNWRILSLNSRYLRVVIGSRRRGDYLSLVWFRLARRAGSLLRRIFGGAGGLAGRSA
jgi:hypothetical protein